VKRYSTLGARCDQMNQQCQLVFESVASGYLFVFPHDLIAKVGATFADHALTIDLSEDDVERADDRGDVREHVTAAEEIHRFEMCK